MLKKLSMATAGGMMGTNQATPIWGSLRNGSLQDCKVPLQFCQLLQTALSKHSPKGNGSFANLVFPWSMCCVLALSWTASPVFLDCSVWFKPTQPFLRGLLQVMLASKQNLIAADSLVVGFHFFFQYLSPLLLPNGCCLSKRGNVQTVKGMMCCEDSKSGAVKQGEIMQPCLDKSI